MGASASVCVGCRAGSITAETVALAGGQPAGGCRGGCRRTVYRFLMCQWPGRGCRLGGSSSVGGVFLIFTLLFLPPAPPSPLPLTVASGSSTWRSGFGGGGLGGLCLGGFCLYQLCFSCMQGSGAPTPLWGGHGAVGRPSAPEPRVEGLASRPAAWAGGNGLCQPLPWHPGGNTQPRPPPPCAGISRVHQTPLQGGGRPRAGVVVVGVIWVPGGATRQHH